MTRVVSAVRRHGFGGSLHLAVARLGRLAYLRESHVWYLLDLGGERPRLGLPPGMEIVRTGRDDLAPLAGLPTIGIAEARRRLAAGVDLWMVLDGGRAAFACWIYHDRTPVLAARGGWLELPGGVVGLEDSVTSPAYRGQSIAPAGWSATADALGREGATAILTKVEESNLPCRRAIEKAGFRAVAAMRLERIGGRSRVDVELNGASGAAFLAERLAR